MLRDKLDVFVARITVALGRLVRVIISSGIDLYVKCCPYQTFEDPKPAVVLFATPYVP